MLPRLCAEGERIKNILESPLLNAIDRTAAEHLRGLLVVRRLVFFFNLRRVFFFDLAVDTENSLSIGNFTRKFKLSKN